jgi:hypothetical protein
LRRFIVTVRSPFLDKTIGVRVTEADYARLQALADAQGQPVGEWCRNVLLDVAKNPVGRPIDQALLGEFIALRVIVVNLIYTFVSEGKVTAEVMQALIDRGDSTKAKRAAELLSQIVRSGNPDVASKTRSAKAAH